MQTLCGTPLDVTHVAWPEQNSPPSPPKLHSRARPASHVGNVFVSCGEHVSGSGCKCTSSAPAFVGESPAPASGWQVCVTFWVTAPELHAAPVVRMACKFVQDGAAPAVHEQLHCAPPPSTTMNESCVA